MKHGVLSMWVCFMRQVGVQLVLTLIVYSLAVAAALLKAVVSNHKTKETAEAK